MIGFHGMVPSAFQSCNLEGCIQHTDSTCVNLLGLGAHREENIGAVVERDWFQVAWFRRHPRIRLHTNAPLSPSRSSHIRVVGPLCLYLFFFPPHRFWHHDLVQSLSVSQVAQSYFTH